MNPGGGGGTWQGSEYILTIKKRREHAHRTNQKEDGLTFDQVYHAQPNPGPKP